MTLTTLEQIQSAVDSGLTVYCDNDHYVVIKDKIGQYLIHAVGSDYYIGLNGASGLNGTKFYIKGGVTS